MKLFEAENIVKWIKENEMDAENLVKYLEAKEFPFHELKKEFQEDHLEWRILRSGRDKNGKPWATAAAYVDARAVQDRLDQVAGAENWSVRYDRLATGTMCTLSIKIQGEWVSKQDGADDPEWESFKGGISSSLRRAASAWGIGRYLYAWDEVYVDFVDKGHPLARYHKDSQTGEALYWVVKGHEAPKEIKAPVKVDATPAAQPKPIDSTDGSVMVNFGKFKGMTISAIYNADAKYVDWLSEKLTVKYPKDQLLKDAATRFKNSMNGVTQEVTFDDVPF